MQTETSGTDFAFHSVFNLVLGSMGAVLVLCLCCKKKPKPDTSQQPIPEEQDGTEISDDNYFGDNKNFAKKKDPRYDTLLMIDSDKALSRTGSVVNPAEEELKPREIEPKSMDREKIKEIEAGKKVDKRDPQYRTLKLVKSDWGESSEEYKRRKHKERMIKRRRILARRRKHKENMPESKDTSEKAKSPTAPESIQKKPEEKGKGPEAIVKEESRRIAEAQHDSNASHYYASRMNL